jgi:photosystem II stability/assembly factor-like uncharacterized protein
MDSDCYSLGRVAPVPGSARMIAGVAKHGLWASDDSGQTWEALGTGAGSAVIENRVSSISFDPANSDIIYETGTHVGGGFYRSTDAGVTFKQLGTMTMSQGAAVDYADPDRKTMLTGTHGKGVWRSTDGGATFTDLSGNLDTDTLWPFLIDANTFLIGLFNGAAGITRTTNAGENWNKTSETSPSHDGGIFQTADGTLYYSLLGNMGFSKSTDQGVSWTTIPTSGTSFPPAFFGITPAELPDGSLVTVGTDHLVRSQDGAATWQAIGEPLPFIPAGGNFGGLTYSAATKTFFLWQSDCNAAVLDNAIMSAGFDWATE